jgi:hypothetical protein
MGFLDAQSRERTVLPSASEARSGFKMLTRGLSLYQTYSQLVDAVYVIMCWATADNLSRVSAAVSEPSGNSSAAAAHVGHVDLCLSGECGALHAHPDITIHTNVRVYTLHAPKHCVHANPAHV